MGDSNFGKTHTASQFHDATNALHRRRAARRAEEPPKAVSDLSAERAQPAAQNRKTPDDDDE